MCKFNNYYKFMDSLGGQLTPSQRKIMEELEDQLVNEEMLPAIKKSISPIISNLRNPLTLVVDYNPKTGIVIKPTRSEIKVEHRERRKDKVHWDIKTTEHYDAQLMIKEVDWSTFVVGVTIPLAYQPSFEHAINTPLIKGSSVKVKIWLDGKEYAARLSDTKFADPKRKRCIQLLWSKKSPLAIKFQDLMSDTYVFMKEQKEKNEGAQMIKLPENLQHEIVICSVPEHDGFLFVLK